MLSPLQIHTCLCAANPGFKHGAGDVEDACWQLLSELQLLLPSHADRAYLARLMAPVADRAPFYTPGAPFKVCVAGVLVLRCVNVVSVLSQCCVVLGKRARFEQLELSNTSMSSVLATHGVC